MPKYNDIDLKKWKDYSDINVDSLWIINNRKKNEYHSNQYHGNFVPQIPEQLIKRYTKKNETVIDLFVGSGTTIYESYDLGRKSIGVDINDNFFEEISDKLQNKEMFSLIKGDSTKTDTINKIKNNITTDNKKAQLLIFHPPYFDIIKFTNEDSDLSNSSTIDEFLNKMDKIISKTYNLLEKGRYSALIIGDIYVKSRLEPLGYNIMNLFLTKGYILKGIVVKNIEETKGKAGNRAIWRYRALASDYYLFKHEYIMIFKKI